MMEENTKKGRKDDLMEARKESRRRNEYKRRSGAVYKDKPGDNVHRRTSQKSPSKDRQGQVYWGDEDYRDMPLRTPTPQLSSSLHTGKAIPISAFSPPRSPSPHASGLSSSQPQLGDKATRIHSRHGSRESNSRPRTRTLEERFSDKNSTSLTSGSRQRGVSLQAKHQDSGSDSIGFPSVDPSPPPELMHTRSQRTRISKPLSRPLSPIRNPIAAKPGTPLSSSTDGKKILQLMKTTCGRMHGILSFRTTAANIWASGYCAINVASGSLIYQTKGDVSLAKTLIRDLRGCQVRTLYDADSRSIFLDLYSPRTNMGIHLRPHVPETFDSWLAALLCWQPIRPKGAQNKMTKPHETQIVDRRLGDRKRYSGSSQSKEAAIIKVGKMLMYEKGVRSGFVSPPPATRRFSSIRTLKAMSKNWRKISCTLQENGHFKIFVEPESTLEAVIPLSTLSRCAIQRLDQSILDDEFTLAIYPQYTSTPALVDPPLRTVYLALESRVLFEVWFVLLRAFTIPDLYGPEALSIELKTASLEATAAAQKTFGNDMFRVERMLSIRITEAKLLGDLMDSPHGLGSLSPEPRNRFSCVGNYYAELQLDGEVRARTVVKKETCSPFWREEFDFVDLPPILSGALIELKTRNPGQTDWTLSHAPIDLKEGDMSPETIEGDIEVSPLDLIYGKVDLRLDDLERAIDIERWWPVLNQQEETVGEMFMKVRVEELVVLLGKDYAALSELLHAFPNGLTNQITQTAHTELKRLSEILLNIFQVSGHATAWLMSLVEDEIDSVHRDPHVSKFRYGRRIASNDSFESGIEREIFLRDLGKNASVEANLLFRGNSLLTKALDLHMRRLGKEYLEDTLSEKMRDIDESDPDCEVDPHRVKNPEDLERNWRNLKALTENIWDSIASSALRCPPELRVIMRRIRDCAEDRYGDFLRSVAYSSVSGFLFLRFFTPAVLNPKLFGLLKGKLLRKAEFPSILIHLVRSSTSSCSTNIDTDYQDPSDSC